MGIGEQLRGLFRQPEIRKPIEYGQSLKKLKLQQMGKSDEQKLLAGETEGLYIVVEPSAA